MLARLSRLIGRLSVGRKLILIYFLDLSAVIFVSGILVNEKFIAIDFARKEIVGNAYIGALRDSFVGAAELPAATGGERGEALRCLLYLYERDEALPLIGAG